MTIKRQQENHITITSQAENYQKKKLNSKKPLLAANDFELKQAATSCLRANSQ